ncbi:MAG: murein biosynthesis integral membrane protein MurJ [Actinomycetota bacterium]
MNAAPGPEPEPEPAISGFARSTGTMAIGTGLSRITGFLRVAALASALGLTESRLADTYNLANTTPNFVFELILGGILSSVLVPVLVESMKSDSREEANHVARAVLTVTVAGLALLALATVVAAPWLMRIFTFRVPGPDRLLQEQVGAYFLRFFMPQIVFYGAGTVMTGVLNANRKFGVPMFAPVLNNLTVIATALGFMALTGRAGTNLAAISGAEKLLLAGGTTLGVAAMTLVQVPFLRRVGFSFRPTWDLGHPRIRKLARLAVYVIGYVIVTQIGYLAIPILANQVQGGYTAYSYALIFFQLPHAIFSTSVVTALLPSLSAMAVGGDLTAFRRTLRMGVRTTATVVTPAAFGYLALGTPIVRLLLEHGVVSRASVTMVVRTLSFLAVGLLSYSTFVLFQRAFYALQDSRTPFLISVVTATANVAANIILFSLLPQAWKVGGLAVGTTLAYTLGAVIMAARMRRRLGGIEGRSIASGIGRAILASAVMAVGAWTAARATGMLVDTEAAAGQAAQVLVGLLTGAILYLAAGTALRIEELAALRTLVFGRFRR